MTSISPARNCRSNSNRCIGFTPECKYAVGTPCSTKKAHRSSEGQHDHDEEGVSYTNQVWVDSGEGKTVIREHTPCEEQVLQCNAGEHLVLPNQVAHKTVQVSR